MPGERDYQLKPFIKVIKPTKCPCAYEEPLTDKTKDGTISSKGWSRKENSDKRYTRNISYDDLKYGKNDKETETKQLEGFSDKSKPSKSHSEWSKCYQKAKHERKEDSSSGKPSPWNKEVKFQIRLMEQIIFDFYDLLDNYSKFSKWSHGKSMSKIMETVDYLIDMLSTRLAHLGLQPRQIASKSIDLSGEQLMERIRESMVGHNFLLEECLELKASVFQEYCQSLSQLWQNLKTSWNLFRSVNTHKENIIPANSEESLTDIIVQHRSSYKRIKHIFHKYNICDPKVINRGLVKLKLESISFLERYKRLMEEPKEKKKESFEKPEVSKDTGIPIPVKQMPVAVGIQCDIAEDIKRISSIDRAVSKSFYNNEKPGTGSEQVMITTCSDDDEHTETTASQELIWQKKDFWSSGNKAQHPQGSDYRHNLNTLHSKLDLQYQESLKGKRNRRIESMLFAGGVESFTKIVPKSSSFLCPFSRSHSMIQFSIASGNESFRNSSFSYSNMAISDESSRTEDYTSLQGGESFTTKIDGQKELIIPNSGTLISQASTILTRNASKSVNTNERVSSMNSCCIGENNTSLELLLNYPDKSDLCKRKLNEDGRSKSSHHGGPCSFPLTYVAPIHGTSLPLRRYPRFKYVKTENYLKPGENGGQTLQKRIYLPVQIANLKDIDTTKTDYVDYMRLIQKQIKNYDSKNTSAAGAGRYVPKHKCRVDKSAKHRSSKKV